MLVVLPDRSFGFVERRKKFLCGLLPKGDNENAPRRARSPIQACVSTAPSFDGALRNHPLIFRKRREKRSSGLGEQLGYRPDPEVV